VFIPVSRHVKVTIIHQDFPELRSQMYRHLFYGSQCRCMFWNMARNFSAYIWSGTRDKYK